MIPSVTKVLSPWIDKSWFTEESRVRGTRRHAACSSIALGVPILRRASEDDGYVQSFRDWFSRYVMRVILVSQRLQDPKLGFSGEPDFLLELIPMIKQIKPGDLVVVDLKPEWTRPRPAWAAQCAGYLHLAQVNKGNAKMAASLHPDQDGGPARLEWYENSPRDFAAFLNCLYAYNFFFAGKEE